MMAITTSSSISVKPRRRCSHDLVSIDPPSQEQWDQDKTGYDPARITTESRSGLGRPGAGVCKKVRNRFECILPWSPCQHSTYRISGPCPGRGQVNKEE